MKTINIKPLTAEYLDAVYEIELASFSIPWSYEALKKEITENKLAFYFVATETTEMGERTIGYCGMWHVVTEGHITNIAVLESHRNKGIGGLLLNRLIDLGYEKEMIGLTLEVRLNNAPAQKLYTKNGFKMEGIRKNYYSDTKEDALVMWKDL